MAARGRRDVAPHRGHQRRAGDGGQSRDAEGQGARRRGARYLLADELAGFVPITPVRSTQLEDRYLDTADGAMARAGFACRLRQTAKGTTVSVKSTARRPDGSGFHRREELEGPADRTAGPRDWPPSD